MLKIPNFQRLFRPACSRPIQSRRKCFYSSYLYLNFHDYLRNSMYDMCIPFCSDLNYEHFTNLGHWYIYLKENFHDSQAIKCLNDNKNFWFYLIYNETQTQTSSYFQKQRSCTSSSRLKLAVWIQVWSLARAVHRRDQEALGYSYTSTVPE